MNPPAICFRSRRDSIQHSKNYSAKSYMAHSTTSPLVPGTIQRREPRPQDVQIEVLYCGVCHSDLHQVRDEWHEAMPTVYPCVPGHEIVGTSDPRWQRGKEIQGRRSRRRRLHGGFRPRMRELPRRPRTILRERCHVHLQQRRQSRSAELLMAATPAASSSTKPSF